MSIESFLESAWLENHEVLSKTMATCTTCDSSFDQWENLDVSSCL